MLFYSQLQGLRIVDAQDRRLAFLRDLSVRTDGPVPVVTGVVAKVWPNRRWLIPWEWVDRVEPHCLRLKSGVNMLECGPPGVHDRLLSQDVLDSQVVDVTGAKVVRVNDIQLSFRDSQVYVLGVDIGPWGLARRLGIAELLAVLVATFHLKVPEGLVPWDVVEPLDKGRQQVQLKVSQDRIKRLHPADLADIYSELGYEQREQLLSELDDAQVADVLEEMEPEEAAGVLTTLDNERAADVLEEMEPDEAADVLGELSQRRAEQLMGLMDAEEAEEVRELLAHEEHTVGALMTTNFITLPPDRTVAEGIAELKAQEAEVEVFNYVYLTEPDERLVGVVALREMLVAQGDRPLRDLSPSNLYSVSEDDEQEDALRLIVKYGLQALPVVDTEERLSGVVTWIDALYPYVPEHLR